MYYCFLILRLHFLYIFLHIFYIYNVAVPHLDILRHGAKKKISTSLRGIPTENIGDKSL
jgi:hypothetical protein